jgi:zinc finger protein BrlA
MSSMTQDLLSGFQDHTFLFSGDAKLLPDQRMTGYNNFSTYIGPICDSFNGNHGISGDTPVLDLDLYSPTSGMGSSPTADFVIPSQTTFLDAFDMHSPMPPARSLHFELQYESPAQDYNADFSSMDNNSSSKWYMPPSSFKQSGSASTTPSKPSSLRQPLYKDEPLQTSIALHQIQESAELDKSKADCRSARRRVKQEIRNCLLPNNIPIHTKASKPCLFEGCGKNFKRQEHLKRHERVHKNIETYPCPCCQKIFGRTDNLKYHVKLHMDAANKKSSRTDFHKDAERYYMEMSRKPRKSEVKTEVKSEVKDVKIPVRSRVLGY